MANILFINLHIDEDRLHCMSFIYSANRIWRILISLHCEIFWKIWQKIKLKAKRVTTESFKMSFKKLTSQQNFLIFWQLKSNCIGTRTFAIISGKGIAVSRQWISWKNWYNVIPWCLICSPSTGKSLGSARLFSYLSVNTSSNVTCYDKIAFRNLCCFLHPLILSDASEFSLECIENAVMV